MAQAVCCTRKAVKLNHPLTHHSINKIIMLSYILKLASGFHTSHLRGTGWWSEKIKINPDRLISSAICLPCEFWHVSDFPSPGFGGFSVLIFPPSYFVVMLSTIQAGFWLVSVTSAITHRCFLCIINHAHFATVSTSIAWHLRMAHTMMSWNENFFRIAGPLWREYTSGLPSQRAID